MSSLLTLKGYNYYSTDNRVSYASFLLTEIMGRLKCYEIMIFIKVDEILMRLIQTHSFTLGYLDAAVLQRIYYND